MDNSTRAGTLCGTAMVLLFELNRAELVSTILLAAIGAVVSFGVSVLMKMMANRFRRK